MMAAVELAKARLANIAQIVPTNPISQAHIYKAKYECFRTLLDYSELTYEQYQDYRYMLELALGRFTQ